MYKLIRGLESPGTRPKGGPLRVIRAVLWSFFGVRRRHDLDSDAATITPLQVIAGGLVGVVCFVCLLLGIVKLVLA